MSVLSMRCFSKFCRIFQSPSDLKYVEKLCIHCSAVHKQQKEPSQDAESKARSNTPVKMTSKEEKISRAMRNYLERKKAADELMTSHIQDYELGKRHLANIMGEDPDDLTEKDLNMAISYLLPSGLFNKKARPMLKHPFEILPKLFSARFDATGRPQHFLFYTVKQSYYDLMHNIAWKIEDLKSAEDEMAKKNRNYRPRREEKINLQGSEWISQRNLEERLHEKISEHEYQRFVVIMEHLANQPTSKSEEKFIMEYRNHIRTESEFEESREILIGEDGRRYQTGKGCRKSAKGTVKVYENGTGTITINGQDITYFKDLIHRQQVIFPLQFTGTMGSVDVVARVSKGGPTGQSGAIRLGLSRALMSFVSREMVEKMRLAGLLTEDPRRKERKKPGQAGARKKFTWKKR